FRLPAIPSPTPPFPTRRSSDLFDGFGKRRMAAPVQQIEIETVGAETAQAAFASGDCAIARGIARQDLADQEDFVAAAINGFADQDRKSTRLNSSHVKISYAVFC